MLAIAVTGVVEMSVATAGAPPTVRVVTVAELDQPVGFTFTPRGRIVYLERATGRVRLIDPSGGEVRLAGEDIATMPQRRLRALRRRVQIVEAYTQAFGADDALAAPVHLPELCARLHARIRDRQYPRGTPREGAVRRSLERLVGEGPGLRPDEIVLALVRRLARAFDLRSCAFVAIEPDGSAHVVAGAGQEQAATGRDEALDLDQHGEIAQAIRLRRLAGRPDGAVTALPAIVDGRVHGILELVRCDGGAALTAAQLQFAEQLAEVAVRALEPPVTASADGPCPGPRHGSHQVTLDHRLQEEFERARRYSLSFSLVLLEVCAAGSEQGAETVERLQRGLRLPDFVARYGGGEYAIVLPETGADGARRSVARVREQLIQGRIGTVAEPPLSAGIVTYPHPAVSQADDLFALVEAALARGKAQSGERVGIAD